MLARLQQVTTLSALLLAAAWAWFHLQAGRSTLAWAGAALLLGAYALVLGLEMLLLRWAHGQDPAPRASAMKLLHAWWGEVRSAPAVFCWRQPFRSQRWPDLLPTVRSAQPVDNSAGLPESAAPRGVLFVHGFVCNRGVWNPWLRRLTLQGTPFVALNLEPVFGSIDDYVAQIEAGVQLLERGTGCAPVIVAHSMGGLAVRRWWLEQGDDSRVHHVLTLASPHSGTWLARFAITRNSQQMGLLSNWLQMLQQREPASRRARFTCFYSHCDNVVFPPSTATLAGADNRHLQGVAHVHMVEHPEPFKALQWWLLADRSAQRPQQAAVSR